MGRLRQLLELVDGGLKPTASQVISKMQAVIKDVITDQPSQIHEEEQELTWAQVAAIATNTKNKKTEPKLDIHHVWNGSWDEAVKFTMAKALRNRQEEPDEKLVVVCQTPAEEADAEQWRRARGIYYFPRQG